MQPTRREEIAMTLLDQVQNLEQQVMNRLKELEPLTHEYDQLRKVAERLGLKYSPGSGQSGDGAPAETKARRPAKRARPAKRTPRRPARAKSAQPRAAKPAAKPRGARSTAAPKAATSAQASGASAAAAPARPRKHAAGSGQRSSGRRGAARPGQRHEDVLRLVGENPGITVRELGERLGVDATGLYRVVNRLSDEGRVRKDGTRLQPVDAPTTSEPKPEATADTAKPTTPATGAEASEEAPSSEFEPSPTVGAGAPSGDS
jgi:hypothetical protein